MMVLAWILLFSFIVLWCDWCSTGQYYENNNCFYWSPGMKNLNYIGEYCPNAYNKYSWNTG